MKRLQSDSLHHLRILVVIEDFCRSLVEEVLLLVGRDGLKVFWTDVRGMREKEVGLHRDLWRSGDPLKTRGLELGLMRLGADPLGLAASRLVKSVHQGLELLLPLRGLIEGAALMERQRRR